MDVYRRAMGLQNWVDFDDLVDLAAEALEGDPAALAAVRSRWTWLFVDEYQDVDEAQFRLVRMLAPAGANVCAIGDPDQAILRLSRSGRSVLSRVPQGLPGCAHGSTQA